MEQGAFATGKLRHFNEAFERQSTRTKRGIHGTASLSKHSKGEGHRRGLIKALIASNASCIYIPRHMLTVESNTADTERLRRMQTAPLNFPSNPANLPRATR